MEDQEKNTKNKEEKTRKRSGETELDLNELTKTLSNLKLDDLSPEKEAKKESVKKESTKKKTGTKTVRRKKSVIDDLSETLDNMTFDDLISSDNKKKEKPKKKKTETRRASSVNTEKVKGVTDKTKKAIAKSNPLNGRPVGKKSTFVAAIVVSCLAFLFVCGIIGAGVVAIRLCSDMPDFHASDLESADSSMIYDSEGNEVIELGMYLRKNIEYDDLSESVIDAFVAAEDSRYFEHFGFDIPRFTKAIIVNLRSGNFDQGGSTMTMQLIKNSYFQVDDDSNSTMAARTGMSGVRRKMQEIALAITADSKLSKQEILALYLNKINFGDNIRGIEKAAEYYFGKSASELNINESAFLAGIINSPNSYNPYNEANKYNEDNIYLSSDVEYLENANNRKNEVLALMLDHGYITQEEYDINSKVRIENLLAGKSEKFASTNPEYQSYIDAVIDEVEEVTGYSPYTKAMNIYTNMNAHLQSYVYAMQNDDEQFSNVYTFKNPLQQNAIVLLNNQTGELVAIGGGRNGEDSARQFNRATDAYLNPGSSIKPILEYALAFDKLGYSSMHTVTDQPVYLDGTDILIQNSYGQGYRGDMLIQTALAMSLNSPAIQLLEEVEDKIGREGVINYLQSIGFDKASADTYDIQWAIGGNKCQVTPVQLAGAHATLMNEGYYVKPHTIKKIEYRGRYNELDDYVADTTGTQVLSSAAAYMTAYLERYNVTSGYINQLNVIRRDYPTFAKTGTTNFGDAQVEAYNMPAYASKDQWVMVQNSNYTIVVWNGFDNLEEGAYFTVSDENYNLKCKMANVLLTELDNTIDYTPGDLAKPSDLEEITFVRGSFPYVTSGGSTVTGYISASSPYKETISLADFNANYKQTITGTLTGMGLEVAGEGIMRVHWGGFNQYFEDGTKDISATSDSGAKTKIAIGSSWFQRYTYENPAEFYATLTSADGNVMEITSNATTIDVEFSGELPYVACGWTSNSSKQKCVQYPQPEENDEDTSSSSAINVE